MRPVSGRKPFAGSAVVIRRCTAPRRTIDPCDKPRSPSDSRSDPQLAGYQIDVGGLLRDRALQLDSWIHLVDDMLSTFVEQELDRPGAAVSMCRAKARAEILSRSSSARLGAGVGSATRRMPLTLLPDLPHLCNLCYLIHCGPQDNLLRVPQNRRVDHPTLEGEYATLHFGSREHPLGPGNLLSRRDERLTDHRHLAGMDGDLDVEADRDRVQGFRA